MKKLYALALLSLLLVPLGLRAQTGTKGNTITFDETNCTQLQSNLASTWFSFLRHNQAPIQILNGNPTASNSQGSADYHTIAPLQEANGSGIFATGDATIANNMAFSKTAGHLEFYNNYANYNALCFAIIAPKGYRFTEYYMDIRSTKADDAYANNDGASNAVITRYTYNAGSTYQYTLASGESMTLSGTSSEIYTHTLSNAGNILYFRITFDQTTSQSCVHMNELRLKYVIDEEFEATIPNNSNENQVRTGILNLGQFTSVGSTYAFTRANVTDLEDVNIVAEEGNTEMAVSDGVINVPAGTYWIESPAKFRITAATLNFQLAAGSTETTYEPTTTLESGKKYKIGDGSGNYLQINNGSPSNSNINNATVWTITKSGSGYTIYSENNNVYLSVNVSGTNVSLGTSTSSFVWAYDSTNRYFTWTRSTNYVYGLRYQSSSGWYAARIRNATTPTSLTFYKETTTSVSGDEAYTATLYGTSASSSVGTKEINTSTTTGKISANNLNNDGVKFTVTGPAAFTVDLTLEPLDPNLQNLEFDYLKNGSDAGNKVSAAATNFKFNNGEAIMLPIDPEVSNPQVVFRNAFNESRNAWYDGNETGLSNYYLVDSQYEINGSEGNAPSDKVDANRAGKTKIEFSNIKDLTTQGGYLTETEFKKTNAGYNTITLTTSPQTIYIYSADKPEYCIMTAANKNVNNHIAYTFYDAVVQGFDVDEDPVIAVSQLFTTSLKRNNVKVPVYNSTMGKSVSVPNDNATDDTHIFYGVKVTSDGEYGFLTSTEIVSAIKTAMASKTGIYSGDVMRTILYVDMSELTSIPGDADTWKEIMLGTGDNCIFFMPSSFSISQEMIGGGIVAGGEGGTAVTNIVINDQQPFYTPYSFRTSTHVASYKRTQTNDKPTVTKSTLVLPFSVMLNSNGNPKPTTDSEDTNVTFYNLTGVSLYTSNKLEDGTYLDGVAGAITATPVTGGVAVANTPYYVTSTENDATTSFKIDAMGVTFAKTNLGEMTSENGNMTAHGSFNGVEKAKADGVLYWSKDYFWYSISEYLQANTVKFLPYRAYYTTSASLTAKEGKFLLLFNDPGETDGIEDGLSRQQTIQSVYDLQGRKLSVGSDQLSTLSKGIYIVNGKKIFVK